MKNKKTLFFIIFILIVVPVSIVIAGFEMQTDWPPSPMTSIDLNYTEHQDITHFIAYLFEWGIALGGLITFIALLIAGFFYMTSVGDPTKMKNAMDRIKAAFLGLALLLSSWLILHTINPDLTTLRPIDVEIGITPADIDQKLADEIRVPPCRKVLFFDEIDFEGGMITKYAGEHYEATEANELPRSFVMCRRIRCREPLENESPTDKHQRLCGAEEIPLELPVIPENGDLGGLLNPNYDICQQRVGDTYIEGGACKINIAEGGWARGIQGCDDFMHPALGPRDNNMFIAPDVPNALKARCLHVVTYEMEKDIPETITPLQKYLACQDDNLSFTTNRTENIFMNSREGCIELCQANAPEGHSVECVEYSAPMHVLWEETCHDVDFHKRSLIGLSERRWYCRATPNN